MPPGQVKGNDLPGGMHACICSTGAINPYLNLGHTLKTCFNLALNRAAFRLELRPQKIGPIVFDNGTVTVFRDHKPLFRPETLRLVY
jgi:hypothetical protein